MIQQNESVLVRACNAQLTIELGDTQYKFISSHASDRIIGQTYQNVLIDEMVEMTAEQTAMIMSRKR
jgi:tRNA(Met) C34 N-acetyltransferase TmcA